jgi:hypothetical protein
MASSHLVIDPSLAISLLSLVVAALTLYLSQFKRATISNVIGPTMVVFYSEDGGFGLFLPVTFLNRSSRTGSILRCALTLFRADSPEQRFFMEWWAFARWEGQRWGYEEVAHALAVPGNSSTAKIIWFLWRGSSKPEFRLVEGQYVMIFHYWSALSTKPRNEEHQFYVDRSMQSQLDAPREHKSSLIVDIVLDQQLAPNRTMTSYEAKSLFGP